MNIASTQHGGDTMINREWIFIFTEMYLVKALKLCSFSDTKCRTIDSHFVAFFMKSHPNSWHLKCVCALGFMLHNMSISTKDICEY